MADDSDVSDSSWLEEDEIRELASRVDMDAIDSDSEREYTDQALDVGNGTGSTTVKPRQERVIDDYDENEEEDEVLRAIIAEIKKPRSKPPDIKVDDFVTDLSFHTGEDILAVGTVTGDVLVYRYANEENQLLHTLEVHAKACRTVEFTTDGTCILSSSRDKSIMITDVETSKLQRFWDEAHEEPVYSMLVIDENLFATGE